MSILLDTFVMIGLVYGFLGGMYILYAVANLPFYYRKGR